MTLKGHVIWSQVGNPPRFLDGQAFGRPVVDANNQARTSLIFPSGDDARASDFESWLYIGGRTAAPAAAGADDRLQARRCGGRAGQQRRRHHLPARPGAARGVQGRGADEIIEVTFNRDLQPEGVFDTGQSQSLLFELMSPDGNAFRRHGELEVKGNLARLIARDPTTWSEPGDYHLTVFGDDAQTGSAFLAADEARGWTATSTAKRAATWRCWSRLCESTGVKDGSGPRLIARAAPVQPYSARGPMLKSETGSGPPVTGSTSGGGPPRRPQTVEPVPSAALTSEARGKAGAGFETPG